MYSNSLYLQITCKKFQHIIFHLWHHDPMIATITQKPEIMKHRHECIASGDDLTQLSRSHAIPIEFTTSTSMTIKINLKFSVIFQK